MEFLTWSFAMTLISFQIHSSSPITRVCSILPQRISFLHYILKSGVSVFDQQPSGLSIFTPLYPPSLPSPEPPCSAFLHFFHYLFDPLVFTYFPPSLVSMFDRLTYLLTRTLNFLKPPLLATYSTNKIPILVHPES